MSTLAQDLQALRDMPQPHGALTEHLMREIALNLIASSNRPCGTRHIAP